MAHLVSRNRWREWSGLREAVFLALAVVFGLQIIRVLLTGLIFYIRDSQGASPAVPGAYAFGVFLLAFLAPVIQRFLGPRGTLALTAGGLALVRLAEQVVSSPAVDLGLTSLGAVLFFLFIPTYVGRTRGYGIEGGRIFAVGLLLGIGIDTAVKGAFATLDLSWGAGVITYPIVFALVGCHWLLLWSILRDSSLGQTGDSRFVQSTALVALGPILFLELLLFQNIGQQTALIDWAQPLVFIWIVGANAVGILAAMGVMARPRQGGWLSVAALIALFVLMALGERSGIAAAITVLFGQITISMSIGMIGVALWSAGTRPGIKGTAVASGLGMMVLLVVAFMYYGNYQFDIPGGSAVAPLIGVAIIFLCVYSVITVLPRPRPITLSWSPVLGAFLLLALPLGYLAAWGEPQSASGTGLPVRVMSYNLHQGFDVNGYLAIEEQAKAIEGQHPDIVVLQEVSRGWVINGSFDMLVWLSHRLDMPYVWGPAADSVWGNAILSRYPMSNARTQPMPNNSQLQLKRSFIEVQVDVGHGKPLTVIATHLHHVESEGYLRDPQVRAVLQAWIGKERSVIMGDLNALPTDSEMLLLKDAGLKDAFVAHQGVSRRYSQLSPNEGDPEADETKGYSSSSDEPSKRIDYIWVSDDLKVRDFSLTDSVASDHLGVAVTLE